MLRRVGVLPAGYPIVEECGERLHPAITRFTVGWDLAPPMGPGPGYPTVVDRCW